MPRIFGRIDKRRKTPVGAALLLGIASSLILILYALVAGDNEELFWSLFAFSGVIFFIPYVVMMMAYLRLKRVPGYSPGFRFTSNRISTVLAGVCALILVFSIILFLFVPGDGVQWTVLAGVTVLIVIGEVLLPKQAV